METVTRQEGVEGVEGGEAIIVRTGGLFIAWTAIETYHPTPGQAS